MVAKKGVKSTKKKSYSKRKVSMKPTTSEYVEVRDSKIHANGVFAAKDIPAGTKLIEYVGEKITKAESERRADKVLDASKDNPELGAVYIFTLNSKHDIDGNVKWNTARLINHSCDPNCESEIDRGHIWISSIKDIKKGDELSYDYGYDVDNYEEHICKCGSKNCVGHIVSQDQWGKLKRKKFFKKLKKSLIFWK